MISSYTFHCALTRVYKIRWILGYFFTFYIKVKKRVTRKL